MQSSEEIRQRKVELRGELRKIRPESAIASGRICQTIGALLDEDSVVASFIALPGEVDLNLFHQSFRGRLVLPRVIGDDLLFYEIQSVETDLEIGAFGIFEPKKDLPMIEVDRIDFFLCPGLGFDRKGGRLGRGKGFYDRTLEKAREETRVLGICFSEQIVDEIPMEPFDFRMHQVITD